MEITGASLLETKSTSPYVQQQLTGYGVGGGYYRMTPQMAYRLWSISDTIADAVSRICWAFEQIEPVLIDKKTREYISGSHEHPFLKLLSAPGPMQSGPSFMYELMKSFLLTGECYPVILGNTRSDPIAMYTVNANQSTLSEDENGWLGTIQFSANFDQHTYLRQFVPNRSLWTYQRPDGLAETIQMYIQRQGTGLRAQSPLDQVYYQATTKYYGNLHNSSMVQKASRPGGLWSPDGKTSMSQSQYEAFKHEIDDKFTGPETTGRNIVAPVPIKYENFLLQTRDMDFLELIKQSGTDIYNTYNIPLPLVLAETMTLNNYQKAIEAMYDFAVLPPGGFLIKALGEYLLPRYKGSENMELGIDERQLTALKERMFNRAKVMREVASFAEDEIRAETGHESLGPEGVVVWKPSTLVPSGEDDEYTGDGIIREGDND